MTNFPHAFRTAALASLLAPIAAMPALAQVRAPSAPTPPEPPMARTFYFGGGSLVNRSYLGVTPRNSSGPADTLGLLVDDVESDRPAAKAGIIRGARLVSIDGIDLRVDPHDLGDYAGEALPESRLRRLLARKQPGDTVSVVVLTDGRKDTKLVVLAESPFATTMRRLSAGRRVLGVSFSQRGSIRDTAGLLVVSISTGGAADNAGINEGDRIVSIDGVDLRVPAADAGSSDGVEARISRFRRALDAARDSQAVKLDVLSDGRHRTVSVVPSQERGFTFNMSGLRDLEGLAGDLAGNLSITEGRSEALRERAEAMRERASVQREMAQTQRELAREQRNMQMRTDERFGRRARVVDRDDDDSDARVTGTIHGRTDGATLSLGGLSLASVDRDFAQQFGRGSESGALVVRVGGDWAPLKAGDVLLTVEGRSVRDGDSLDVAFDRGRDQRLEILRNGKKETITLPPNR